MASLNIPVPADLVDELSAAAREEGRSTREEGVALLRSALAARRLGSFLAGAGSMMSDDEAMAIALEEQQAARSSR